MRRAAIFLTIFFVIGQAAAQDLPRGYLGVELEDITIQEAAALGWESPRGAKVVSAPPESPASKAGLQSGDILDTLDGVEIVDRTSLEAALSSRSISSAIVFRVRRGQQEKRIAVSLDAASKSPVEASAIPQLAVDAGGHMSRTNRLLFTPDGNSLISGGNDKLIRIWDWRTGRTIRTIRGQSLPGAAGRIYSLALSPDGRWLAAAGPFPGKADELYAIRLYDFATGEMKALLKGHANLVTGIAFSRDSSRLVSGGYDRKIVVWDVAAARIAQQIASSPSAILSADFAGGSDRVVTAHTDKIVRLWSIPDAREVLSMPGHRGFITAVAAASSGRFILSGDAEGEIRVWDPQTGTLRRTLKTAFSVGSLSISPDETKFVSTCGNRCTGNEGAGVTVWDEASGQKLLHYGKHNNIILSSAISPDGKFVASEGSTDRVVRVWDIAKGADAVKADGSPSRLGGSGVGRYTVAFSKDGRMLAWGTAPGRTAPLDNYISLPVDGSQLGAPLPLVAGSSLQGQFRSALISSPSLALNLKPDSREQILEISQNKTVAASIKRERHASFTLAVNADSLVTGGSEGALVAYTKEGRAVGPYLGHNSTVWALSPSPDGKLLASASSDQTICLWNIKTRELIATLFQGTDGDWVMWTPQGFYTGSPGADKIVGWQINKGPDKAAEYVTAEQLRKKLNRPDIVARAIALASAEQAVKEAAGAEFKIADLLKQPVPKLKIKPMPEGFVARGGSATVEVSLGQTPDPIKAIRIHVNGRQIAELSPEEGAGFGPGTKRFTVPLAKGANAVSITAINEIGEAIDTVQIAHEGTGLLDKRGTLYILAIGVDKYPGLPGSDLSFAGADAKAFTEAMEKRAGSLHQKVVKRMLVNGGNPDDAPTAANIADALQVLRKANETDTVMLFVAGHGVNDGLNYRFVPTDAKWTDEGELRASTVVPWHAFQEAVEGAKGARLMFLDTCHSANAYNPRLLNESVHANILVYTSTRWDQLANETSALGGGHGLFTLALVEGVLGKAKTGAGEVRTDTLRDYVRERVKTLVAQLKQSEQEPQFYRGRDAENYLLAIAN